MRKYIERFFRAELVLEDCLLAITLDDHSLIVKGSQSGLYCKRNIEREKVELSGYKFRDFAVHNLVYIKENYVKIFSIAEIK